MALSFDDRITIYHYQLTDSDRHRKFLVKVKAPQDWSDLEILAMYDVKNKKAWWNPNTVLGSDVETFRTWLSGFIEKEKARPNVLEQLFKESGGDGWSKG